MNKRDYNRLVKIIDSERSSILFKQVGYLDYVSIDNAVLNNLSVMLSRSDLQKVVSIMAHYKNNNCGTIEHDNRAIEKIKIKKKILSLRRKQKRVK